MHRFLQDAGVSQRGWTALGLAALALGLAIGMILITSGLAR
jgi:hypothetical protein